MKCNFLILILFKLFYLSAQTEIECDGFLEEFNADYVVSYTTTNSGKFYGLVDKKTLTRVLPDTMQLVPKYYKNNVVSIFDQKTELYQLFNFKEKKVLHKNISEISVRENGVLIKQIDPKIRSNGLMGDPRLKTSKFIFLDENCQIITSINALTKGTLFMNKLNSFSDGLSLFNYDEQISFGTESSPFMNLYGYYNTKGEIEINPRFTAASNFSDGLAAVIDSKSKVPLWGFIDTTGKVVIEYKFSIPPANFNEGLARVKSKDKKYGFINKKGEVVIPAIYYKAATEFYKGHTLIQKERNSPMTLIDVTGKEVVQYTETRGVYGSIKELMDDNCTAVKDKKGKSRIMNREGTFLSPPDFGSNVILTQIGRFSNGIAHANLYNAPERKRTKGFIDETGKFVLIAKKSEF